jgi:hypothetical protein
MAMDTLEYKAKTGRYVFAARNGRLLAHTIRPVGTKTYCGRYDTSQAKVFELSGPHVAECKLCRLRLDRQMNDEGAEHGSR